MRFHAPSFLLGVGVTAVVVATRDRLRPVVVEASALGVHLSRLGRALFERQREHAEDLWAEIDERVREHGREARRRREVVRATPHGPSTNGAGAAR
jgi:hypothetical protein